MVKRLGTVTIRDIQGVIAFTTDNKGPGKLKVSYNGVRGAKLQAGTHIEWEEQQFPNLD